MRRRLNYGIYDINYSFISWFTNPAKVALVVLYILRISDQIKLLVYLTGI